MRPAFLYFTSEGSTFLGVSSMARHALGLFVRDAIRRRMDTIEHPLLDSHGVPDELAARWLASSYALHNDPDPNAGPRVFGGKTFLPVSAVDRAVQEGPNGIDALLDRAMTLALSQDERDDSLTFLETSIIRSAQDWSELENDLRKTPGYRKTLLGLAVGQGETPDAITSLQEAWAWVVGGKAHDTLRHYFNDENAMPPPQMVGMLEALANEISIDPGQCWLGWQVFFERGVKNTPKGSHDMTTLNQMKKLRGLAQVSPNDMGGLIDIGVAPSVAIPVTWGDTLDVMTPPAISFNQIKALWNQGMDREASIEEAEMLISLIHEEHQIFRGLNLDGTILTRKPWLNFATGGREANNTEKSVSWMASLADTHRTCESIQKMEAMRAGLGTRNNEKTGRELLDCMFPEKSIEAVPVGTESTLGRAVGDAMAQALTEGNTGIALALIQRGFRDKGGRLELLEEALSTDGLEKAMETVQPSPKQINKLSAKLRASNATYPRLTALINDWWYANQAPSIDDDLFKTAWDSWTEGDSEALMHLRTASMAKWKRDCLARQANMDPEMQETRRPKM